MFKTLRTYWPFAKNKAKSVIIYKANYISSIIGELISCFILYFIWQAVYGSNPGAAYAGFTMVQMVMYVFLSFTSRMFTENDASWTMSEAIKDGSICMALIKPVKYHLSIFFEQLGTFISLFFIPVLTIVGVEWYNYAQTGTLTPAVNIVLFFISASLGMLLSVIFGIMVGYLAFFLKNLWGTNTLIGAIMMFMTGSLIPFALLPNGVRIVLQILPFASMNYTPIMLYLGKYSVSQIITNLSLQIIWVIIFYILSKVLWKQAIKHLSVQGG